MDGTALAYRSYFAFIRNPLINSKGINTSGIFGFAGTLMRILKEEKPEHIACAFDTPAPTFRHREFPEYKATRQKMPDELVEQIPLIRKLVEAFAIPIVEKEGYEADDVIGTLTVQARKEDLDVVLVTGDKDFMQLVSDRVRMASWGRSGGEMEVIDPKGVKEKWGVDPGQITDLLALMGDSSDNVPGIPGIGPKTSQELISEFGSLESVYERIDEVAKPRIRELLLAHREKAFLSKRLVTIATDVPLQRRIDDLVARPADRESLVRLFQEMEFKKYLDDLSQFVEAGEPGKDRQYRTLKTVDELKSWVDELRRQPMTAVDLETTSLDPMSAEIVGLSFSFRENEAVYIPVRVPGGRIPGDLFSTESGHAVGAVLDILKPVLEDPSIRKCGQNIKYDMLVLRRHRIDLANVDFDTMVAAYLINPSARQFGIDALSLEYLNLKKIPTKSLIGVGKKQISMADVDVEKVSEYACEDADAAFRLRQVLEPKIKEFELVPLFRDVEMPLVRVLCTMEENGVALDVPFLGRMSESMEKELGLLRNKIFEMADETFNINSTQQLGRVLFDKLKIHEAAGLRRPKRTKTGYATDVDVLESLASHPLPRTLLDFRQLTKLKSTYVDALPKLINPLTRRVHASFNQTATATGRISTSDPNLQNIPIRTELGREIRKAFVAGRKGWQLVSADYNQIELRIMAHLSGDETLLESFNRNEDVHKRTAMELFGIREDEVTAEHRRRAKTINFGIMYGMGPFGLAQRLGISLEEAQQFIAAYFSRYPKVNTYIARTIGEAHRQGYVTTLLHRRRILPELKSENRNIRDFGERTAINTPIQGTAADLIKTAMVRIDERLRTGSWKSRMILQIHDELLFETPEGEIERLSEMVRNEMENALSLSVQIRVDIGKGRSWFEAH